MKLLIMRGFICDCLGVMQPVRLSAAVQREESYRACCVRENPSKILSPVCKRLQIIFRNLTLLLFLNTLQGNFMLIC